MLFAVMHAHLREGKPMSRRVHLPLRVLMDLSISAFALLGPIAVAQSLGDIRAPREPLVLREQGSFFVGGRQIHSDAGDTSFIALPAAGLHGSSPMFMRYRNKLEVADVIIHSIDRHVDGASEQDKDDD
jgi:hypothetical protein